MRYALPPSVIAAAMLGALALSACGGSSSSGGSTLSAPSPFDTSSLAWMVNSTGERSQYIFEDTDQTEGVLVNVQSVATVTDDSSGEQLVYVETTGIPSYEQTLSQDDVDALDSRPNARSDFADGHTTAVAGEAISFGQDIGYNSSIMNCNDTGGIGFWPPGPECPLDVEKQGFFPADPQPNESGTRCDTGLGVIGYWVNGVSIFNWSDGVSYRNQRVWNQVAAINEVYDIDICSGHAAGSEYHHHSYPNCLATQLGDDGSGHSPIYGYAADGYPIYGPWEAAGVLAKSSWVKRDYDDPSSSSGCGVATQRTCLLVDQYDLSKGTTTTRFTGPKTTDTIDTLSRNQITAVSGTYFEDYYYDATLSALGGEYLDEHNGHTDEEHGYHYHVTAVEDPDTGELDYAFPGTFGPSFYGVLPSVGITDCGGLSPGLYDERYGHDDEHTDS